MGRRAGRELVERVARRGRAVAAAPDGLDDPAVRALFASGASDPVAALAEHLTAGWRRGLDPHPLFATRHYLAHSRDVAVAGMCPLVHYARHGAFELRSPHPLFDPVHYTRHGAAAWDATIDPLRHYLDHAGRDGRQPNAWFDGDFYRRHAPDVDAAGVNPLVHYATIGWREGRDPHPAFSVAHYLAANPDVADAGREPLGHFLRVGARQGRTPSPRVAAPYAPSWEPDPVAASDVAVLPISRRRAPVPMPAPADDAVPDSLPPPPERDVADGALTVVVASSGDVVTLPLVLAALEEQTVARDRYDVIVVAGTADTVLARWAEGAGRRLAVVPGTGPADRRNLGLFLATAPIVLFLADDEAPDPTLIAEHLRAHAHLPGREVAVVGHTRWADGDDRPLAEWMDRADVVPLGYPGNARSPQPELVHHRARQLSVKRSFLALRGAFDPAYERFHDVELAIRLELHGLDLRSWPRARSSRLGPCELDALAAELAADGPELLRLAAADPSGLVHDLGALDGAARMAQPSGRGSVGDGANGFHEALRTSRARGIAAALAAPPSPTGTAMSPVVVAHDRPAPIEGPRPRVLVVGVVLADRANSAAATSVELAGARHHDVDQRWIVVGGGRRRPSPDVPDRHVAERRSTLRPKYELLGSLLAAPDVAAYDHVLLVDDDVDLPVGFLDAFVDLQRALGLVLAQPARVAGSPADHPIVLQQAGCLARRTLFVEQGPVLGIARGALDAIVPFDLRSPMGWGYEAIWSHRLDGVPIGIVDATPVAHRLRPTAAFYAKAEGETASAALLAAVPHRPLDECMRVLDVHPLDAFAPDHDVSGRGPTASPR